MEKVRVRRLTTGRNRSNQESQAGPRGEEGGNFQVCSLENISATKLSKLDVVPPLEFVVKFRRVAAIEAVGMFAKPLVAPTFTARTNKNTHFPLLSSWLECGVHCLQ